MNEHTPDHDHSAKNPETGLTLNSMLTLPIVKMIAGCVVLLSVGWAANAYVVKLTRSIETVGEKVDLIRIEVRAELETRTKDRYTRTDHRFWAYELDRANGGKIVVPATPQPTEAR